MGEAWAERVGVTCLHRVGDGGWVEWTVEEQERLALPAELLTARPKRLRLLIFNTPGRLVHHARRLVLRLATTAARLAQWQEALRLLPLRV